mgnify:CR=1 FL=1
MRKGVKSNQFYIPTLGNPTRFAPIPNPAPPRADEAMVGTKTSNTEKVAAAVSAMTTISSIFNCFLGMAKAAIATMIPSTMYLIARLTNSLKSIPDIVIIYNSKIKKCA